MKRYYPQGMDHAKFDQAVKELQQVVGEEWVFLDADTELQPYLDRMSAKPIDYRVPSVAVAAASVEEIQEVLKVARAYSLPLWSTGNGRNFAYGGPAVKQSGYVHLDLKRMNRIIEVNEDLAYAVVEPGVSYYQLYQHIQEKGYKLWIDCAAPGWGGLIGNAHEHGAGYTPYGDHFTFQNGAEVMLSDGSVVRTGPWAMSGSKTPHIVKYGYGPYLDGMFTQGNFGIITKAGFWLMPEPPAYKPFLFTYERDEDLHQIMEILRPLKINQVIPNSPLVEHGRYTCCVQANREDYWTERTPVPEHVWQQMYKDFDVGAWNVYGALYGTDETIAITWPMVKQALLSIPGARAFEQGDRPDNDVSWNYREKLMRGEPNMSEFAMVNWGGGGHLNFTPLTPSSGKHATTSYENMAKIFEKYGFDYLTEFVAAGRAQIHMLILAFDPNDEDERQRADACAREIILEAARLGFGELKANLEYMDLVASTYSNMDNGLAKLNQKLKDILDPAGILSPGKSGIWPSGWPDDQRGHQPDSSN
ncbi:MAG: oxidoreductase [Gammaproteobacteria bacterium]|nr:MAG: oxidoreductase [Gammaproteobacteria bacterium]